MLPPVFPASPPADALAVLQAFDCVSTRVILRGGGFERNPIARAAGASKSLPLCLAEAGAINLGLRSFDKTKGRWLTKALAVVELSAVANNTRVLLHFHTP